MGPEDLRRILSFLPAGRDERLLSDLSSPDDAAVYALDATRAVVATLDFFTPLVDGPRDFGAIAASNALGDVYAMGAEPAFALGILAFPVETLAPEVVGGILEGAAEVCAEAGILIAGGHSIDDPEPKFGLVAVGTARADGLWRKGGARPGDALVLGKALGTGLVTTGIKRDATPAGAAAEAIASMRRLNREAAERLREFEPRAVTDVSGYGLLGHLREMCEASGTSARVRAAAPQILPDALRLAGEGCVPGGSVRNRRAVDPLTRWEADVPEPLRTVLCDAQTSGGLLAAVDAGMAGTLAQAWREAGYAAAVVGTVEPPGETLITVEA